MKGECIMSAFGDVVAGARAATREFIVAKTNENKTCSANEIASLYQVNHADVASIQEPEVITLKDFTRWNYDRLDGKAE